MAELAEALAARGRQVTYIVERLMSPRRASQGWQAQTLEKACLRFAPNVDAVHQLVNQAPTDSIHICQGFRGNRLIGAAQQALAARELKQWVIMETVDDVGWRGPLKRLVYRHLIYSRQTSLEGVLATGHATPDWLIRRGMPRECVFPFAYFLPERRASYATARTRSARYRVMFVGQFIERKRLDLLIDALAGIADDCIFELVVAGSGSRENELRAMAQSRLAGRVEWLGRLSLNDVPAYMATADCLVLPSRHDGWGAVISEALMTGTPAICSDRCGVAGAVKASGCGGVFRSGDVEDLSRLLRCEIARGLQTSQRRLALADWAKCLGAKAGAAYLDAILSHAAGEAERPPAPFLQEG